MAIELTNFSISEAAGQPAFLPNQPIIHNCVVDSNATAALKPGDIVTLSTEDNKEETIVVKQAAVTDLPFGVVAFSNIKTGYVANDRISVYPDNSFVKLTAGGSITRGSKLQFTAANKVAATSTASNGYIGFAVTEASADGDLLVVQIKPSI